jgi:CRISPR-associated endonuclease/helicase Cas3
MTLDTAHFDLWFRTLNNLKAHEGPFPWQRRLFHEWLCPRDPNRARWPRLIGLPTASGKTAIIDLAVLALAAGSPCARRRIALVVDRRVVVDEAARRAEWIAGRLRESLDRPDDALHEVALRLLALGGEEPLVVATLRGGIPGDDGWARSPVQPAVVLSTVDQVGSRLLFRAYGGHGPRSWPIHAGLLGRDTLLVIDEAHCATPFCQTAQAIAERWQHLAERAVGEQVTVVRMSATPAEDPEFGLDPEDRGDQTLNRRLGASKAAALKLIQANRNEHRRRLVERIAEEAHALLRSMTSGVVGVVVNRVRDARTIFERLELPEDRKVLLTGRVRGWERDRLVQEWLPRLRAGSREEGGAPAAVVATQCIEVGANLDFDFLVTEVAALDALRQRFGRLDRLGERRDRLQRLGDRAAVPGVVLAASPQVEFKADGTASVPDPVYGQALGRAWAWLTQHAQGDPPCIDFGIDALDALLPEGEDLSGLCQGLDSAYMLLPAHLDLLVQTSPLPQPEPEISAFLHGTTESSPDVTVVWRCDLPQDKPSVWRERVAVQPPVTGEGCPVPIWEFRKWLAEAPSHVAEEAGDVEGVAPGAEAAGVGKPVLRWRGVDESEVVAASRVMPGDIAVVPSGYGGCDKFGWNPGSAGSVTDLGDAVAFLAGKRPVLRMEPLKLLLCPTDGAEAASAIWEDLARWAAGEEEAPPGSETLARLADLPGLPEWLYGLARTLAVDGRCRRVDAAGAYAIVGRRSSGEDFSTAGDASPVGARVPLTEHSAGVRGYAERFARAACLPDLLVGDIALAAWLHDVGKADPRFQIWLHGGDEVSAALAEVVLAKSGENPRNRAAIRRARQRARYPQDARHEAQSLALIAGHEEIRKQANDWELVQHLVVSHHGFGRPFVPVVVDLDPVLVSLEHDALRMSQRSDHQLHRIDSGVAERYWRLVRRYGWWGLAWLEALVRLADHRQSEDEERRLGRG